MGRGEDEERAADGSGSSDDLRLETPEGWPLRPEVGRLLLGVVLAARGHREDRIAS